MRAIGVREFGGADALETVELPEPQPGPGEVRIRVHAAAVNPTDTLFRSGAQASRLAGRRPPFVPGMDAAGVVDRIGPDGDGRLAVGDRVIVVMVPRGPHGGAYAEQVVAPAASVVPAPAGFDLPAASTLLMNALTARLTLDALALRPGQAVGVTGSAGAYGGYVIQLAKVDGLRVIADSSDADRELVRTLGADEIVPRGAGISAAIRAVAPAGVAGVADGAVQLARTLPAIADGGGLAVVRGWKSAGERAIRVHEIQVAASAEDTARLDRLRRQAEEGVLTLRVAQVLPAAEAAEAHKLLEAGGIRGRLVLDFTV
jgi:NADPH:quinone reductase-like Zn-dependent oxidoreductase